MQKADPDAARCLYFIPTKKRRCKFQVKPGQQYCGNHLFLALQEGQKRIPCPIDPRHTVLESELHAHIRRCPKAHELQEQQAQPYYDKDTNAGSDDEGEFHPIGLHDGQSQTIQGTVLSTKDIPHDPAFFSRGLSAERQAQARAMGPEKFMELVHKVEAAFEKLHPPEGLPTRVTLPMYCEQYMAPSPNRPYWPKHALQQASMIGSMERAGLLPMLPKSILVEFGAGKGYLSDMIAECCGVAKVVLMDCRGCFKLKADRSLRKCLGPSNLHRITCPIQDFRVSRLPDLRNDRKPWVATGKHLCGAASDFMLRSCAQAELDAEIDQPVNEEAAEDNGQAAGRRGKGRRKRKQQMTDQNPLVKGNRRPSRDSPCENGAAPGQGNGVAVLQGEQGNGVPVLQGEQGNGKAVLQGEQGNGMAVPKAEQGNLIAIPEAAQGNGVAVPEAAEAGQGNGVGCPDAAAHTADANGETLAAAHDSPGNHHDAGSAGTWGRDDSGQHSPKPDTGKTTKSTNTFQHDSDAAAGPNDLLDATAGPNDSDTAAGPNDSDATAGPNDSDATAGPNDSDATAGPNDSDTTAGPNDSDATAGPNGVPADALDSARRGPLSSDSESGSARSIAGGNVSLRTHPLADIPTSSSVSAIPPPPFFSDDDARVWTPTTPSFIPQPPPLNTPQPSLSVNTRGHPSSSSSSGQTLINNTHTAINPAVNPGQTSQPATRAVFTPRTPSLIPRPAPFNPNTPTATPRVTSITPRTPSLIPRAPTFTPRTSNTPRSSSTSPRSRPDSHYPTTSLEPSTSLRTPTSSLSNGILAAEGATESSRSTNECGPSQSHAASIQDTPLPESLLPVTPRGQDTRAFSDISLSSAAPGHDTRSLGDVSSLASPPGTPTQSTEPSSNTLDAAASAPSITQYAQDSMEQPVSCGPRLSGERAGEEAGPEGPRSGGSTLEGVQTSPDGKESEVNTLKEGPSDSALSSGGVHRDANVNLKSHPVIVTPHKDSPLPSAIAVRNAMGDDQHARHTEQTAQTGQAPAGAVLLGGAAEPVIQSGRAHGSAVQAGGPSEARRTTGTSAVEADGKLQDAGTMDTDSDVGKAAGETLQDAGGLVASASGGRLEFEGVQDAGEVDSCAVGGWADEDFQDVDAGKDQGERGVQVVDGNGPHSGLQAVVLAPCCHHRCTWKAYVGKKVLKELGIGKEEFDVMSWMTGWALCGHDSPPGMGELEDEEDVNDAEEEVVDTIQNGGADKVDLTANAPSPLDSNQAVLTESEEATSLVDGLEVDGDEPLDPEMDAALSGWVEENTDVLKTHSTQPWSDGPTNSTTISTLHAGDGELTGIDGPTDSTTISTPHEDADGELTDVDVASQGQTTAQPSQLTLEEAADNVKAASTDDGKGTRADDDGKNVLADDGKAAHFENDKAANTDDGKGPRADDGRNVLVDDGKGASTIADAASDGGVAVVRDGDCVVSSQGSARVASSTSAVHDAADMSVAASLVEIQDAEYDFDPAYLMSRSERMALGLKCKMLIDLGRKQWMEERGWETDMAVYIQPELSGENKLFVARCKGFIQG